MLFEGMDLAPGPWTGTWRIPDPVLWAGGGLSVQGMGTPKVSASPRDPRKPSTHKAA